MRARFPWFQASSTEHPEVELLTAQQARALRLPWLSRFSTHTLEAHVSAHPGHSVWVPTTGEYAIGAPWRYRSEVAQVLEVTARKGKSALLTSLVDIFRSQDYKLALVSDETRSSDPHAYTVSGFGHLERIVFFHRELRARDFTLQDLAASPIMFERAGPHDLDLLLCLDHASFPWLWWNSPIEFEFYIQQPDVHVYMALHEGEAVGYTSFTMYKGWAHLDRLAVVTSHQGQGLGVAQLRHTLCAMQNLGALSVNLSTQENNVRSHRLYKSFGFRQTSDKMDFYGLDLDKLAAGDIIEKPCTIVTTDN